MLSKSALMAITATLILIAIYRYIVYPLFLSPLSKIPVPHFTCHFCPVWFLWKKYHDQEIRAVYELHKQKGPILRLAPNELSLNCFDGGLKQIYLGGFPQTDFYPLGFNNYETENIFTMTDNAQHAARKRIISNTFSKTYIMASPTATASTKAVLFGRLLPLFQRMADEDQPIEVLGLNFSYSMDSFVNWQFGVSLGSNLVEDEQERKRYLDAFFASEYYSFWPTQFPGLTSFLKKIGVPLIPKWVEAGALDIEAWNMDKCDKAQGLLTTHTDLSEKDRPVVFAQAYKSMSVETSDKNHSTSPGSNPQQQYPQRLEIASDMFAHNSAAHETSGVALTYAFYELSRRPALQVKLRNELMSLSQPLLYPIPSGSELQLPPPKEVDSLPLLDAIIMETLRVWPPVPGGQPRKTPFTPSGSVSLGGFDHIPPNVNVQCYAYVLHRNPDVFPNPEEWKPERWLQASPEELSTMRRWFWAFGSGGAMCIGSNFALYSMKHAIAGIWTNFTTSIYEHGDMIQEDQYLAGPKGKKLMLKFHHV